MAAAAISRAIVCELGQKQQQPSNRDPALPTRGVRLPEPRAEGGKIVLQPRLCTLRSYGGKDAGMMRKSSERDASPFFVSLADYIESSRKSQQFEIVSGRLAMVCTSNLNNSIYSFKKVKFCNFFMEEGEGIKYWLL